MSLFVFEVSLTHNTVLVPGTQHSYPIFLYNIQKTKIMASGPISLWQIDGETMQIVTYFIFLGSKVTADSDCSHKIKRCLLLGRKATTNLPVSQRSHSVLSSSLRSRGLWPTRLLHPWNFPGKSPGVAFSMTTLIAHLKAETLLCQQKSL